jgi:hypothetical protein
VQLKRKAHAWSLADGDDGDVEAPSILVEQLFDIDTDGIRTLKKMRGDRV